MNNKEKITNRDYVEVMKDIISYVPQEEAEFIVALNDLVEQFKVDEGEGINSHWHATQMLLVNKIPLPKEDWEFKVISNFINREEKYLRQIAGKLKDPKGTDA